jgi:hypothetical protein
MAKETHTTATATGSGRSEEAHASYPGTGDGEFNAIPFPMPFGDMGEVNSSVFDAYVRTSQAILESAAVLNQEMVRFAGERLQADLEALQTLPGYTNMQGAVSFQSDYMRRAAEAYQAEFTKLMQQNSDAVSTIFEPLIESVRTSAKGNGRK